jgi:group I intron endonuclease
MHICPNGKKYIGITRQKPEHRWNNGKGYNEQYFKRAIEKYGWDNFKHIILFEKLTQKEAEQKEIELIAYYKSNKREYGYNIQNGGNCKGKYTQEEKEKMSISIKNAMKNPKVKNKISKALKGNKNRLGKKLSDETKIKISNSHLKSQKKKKYKKPVICIEKNKIYPSIKEASRITNIDSRCIQKVCKGIRKTAGNYTWKFAKEE